MKEKRFVRGEAFGLNGKETKRIKVIEYLGNPENPWIDRQTLATEVLGYSKSQSLWNLFPGAELNEIEQEALQMRRKRCATTSGKVDQALLERALSGDVAAIKLYYQRYESWSEKQILNCQNADDIPRIVFTRYEDESGEVHQAESAGL